MQEIAFTLANGDRLRRGGDRRRARRQRVRAAPVVLLQRHNNFLEEIAKFRAARRLWARIMRDRFGATNPRAQQLRFHTQTAGSTLTAQQPDNNIVRVALQALAAVLGGTQSLHCNGRDEALALPTEEAARLALRTQQIIACRDRRREHRRSGRRRRTRSRRRPTARGGGAQRCSSGSTRRRHAGGDRERDDSARDSGVGVPRAAGRRRRRGDRRRREPLRRRDEATADAPRCLPHRSGRRARSRSSACARSAQAAAQATWRAALDAVERAARGGDNLVPPIIAAVEAHATVGEIADAHAARVRRVRRSDAQLAVMRWDAAAATSKSASPDDGLRRLRRQPLSRRRRRQLHDSRRARRSGSSANRAAASR